MRLTNVTISNAAGFGSCRQDAAFLIGHIPHMAFSSNCAPLFQPSVQQVWGELSTVQKTVLGFSIKKGMAMGRAFFDWFVSLPVQIFRRMRSNAPFSNLETCA